MGFFDAKGVLESVFGQIQADVTYEPYADDSVLSAGRTARLMSNGKAIGLIGEVSDTVLERFDLDGSPVAMFEIDLALMLEALPESIQKYQSTSHFPESYRDLALIVDAKQVPEDAVELLSGLRVLVLNALWHGDPHPTHFNVEEALEVAERLGAERTFLTHLTHRLDHESLERELPNGIAPAYDGLSIDV